MSPITPHLVALFESKTILPMYKLPHVIYTILRYGSDQQGVGRYRLNEELNIGEGTIKTLIHRLQKAHIIKVENTRQSGHRLTEHGISLYRDIQALFSIPQEISNNKNSFVLGDYAFFSQVYNPPPIEKIQPITLRDEAIKIGGTGTSTLFFNGSQFTFVTADKYITNIPEIDTTSLHSGAIFIIGGAKTKPKAILTTIAAIIALLGEI